MQQQLHFAVGSQNPTKVDAVRAICAQAFPEAKVIAADVPSGIREQPIGQEETLLGARNRAMAALAATSADYGIGLEGGVVDTPAGTYTMGWVAIVDRDGRWGLSQSGWLALPPAVARAVLSGSELGPEIDRLTGEHDTKRHGGATGALTNNIVRRQTGWELAVAYALAPFLNPQYYKGGDWMKRLPQ